MKMTEIINMVTVVTYRNKRNPNKIIDVKRTSDGHYLWRQRMVWGNIVNHVGTKKGGFRRQRKATIDEVLMDYTKC